MAKKKAAPARGKGRPASALELRLSTLKKQHAELAGAHARTQDRIGDLQNRVVALEEQISERLAEALGAVAYGPHGDPALDMSALRQFLKLEERRPWYRRAWASITRASAQEA